MDMVTPPLVGDLRTEVITGMVGGDAAMLDNGVIEAMRWFMIKTPL
jgi:hypothetical protein